MNIKVLMISGYIKSGKDTVADYFVSYFRYKKVPIAYSLKNFVKKRYGFTDYMINTHKGKDTIVFQDITVRDLLILEANNAKKKDPYIWVDNAIDYIKNKYCSRFYNKFVVSDFRYKEEYERIVSNFGKENVITINVRRKEIFPVPGDLSENSLKDFKFDYVIDNNGSLEELFDKVKEFA